MTIFVGFVSISSISVLASGLYNPTYRFSCHDQSSHLSNSPWYSGGGNSLISPPIPLFFLTSSLVPEPKLRYHAKFHYTIQTIQSNLTRSITFPSHTTVCFLCAASSRPVLSQCHSALLHSQMHRKHYGLLGIVSFNRERERGEGASETKSLRTQHYHTRKAPSNFPANCLFLSVCMCVAVCMHALLLHVYTHKHTH